MRQRKRTVTVALFVAAALCGPIATQTGFAASGSRSEAVARIGNHAITLEQVDDRARADNVQAFQQLYDARKAALDALVEDYLLEKEAKARGISKEKLVAAEIESKVGAVTDADIDGFYNQNKARMGGKTLEQVKDQIGQYLGSQKQREARGTFVTGLKKKTSVKILLDPPRAQIALAANDPRKGPTSAPITVVEYSDFQ